jgi:HD-like signal output (HDOD) protein
VLQAERDLCALDHCDVGAYLGTAWKLPDVFREVASKHHQATEQTGIVGLIHLACAMADDITFAAISHRGLLTLEERVDACVPKPLRQQVNAQWTGAEDRIRKKVNLLDF